MNIYIHARIKPQDEGTALLDDFGSEIERIKVRVCVWIQIFVCVYVYVYVCIYMCVCGYAAECGNYVFWVGD